MPIGCALAADLHPQIIARLALKQHLITYLLATLTLVYLYFGRSLRIY